MIKILDEHGNLFDGAYFYNFDLAIVYLRIKKILIMEVYHLNDDGQKNYVDSSSVRSLLSHPNKDKFITIKTNHGILTAHICQISK